LTARLMRRQKASVGLGYHWHCRPGGDNRLPAEAEAAGAGSAAAASSVAGREEAMTTEADTQRYKPIHQMLSPKKLSLFVSLLRERGYCFPPLVKVGNQLLTGGHRYGACKQLGWPDSAIPTVPLESVLAEAGLAAQNVWPYACITLEKFIDTIVRWMPEEVWAKYWV